MSTLKTNTIQHLTSGFNNVVQFTDGAGTQNGRLCRAWVLFNGTGVVSITGSFNVSTITDNGTGNYTVNFSNAMTDTAYCAVTSSQYAQVIASINITSSSGVQIRTYDKGGNVDFDATPVCTAIFR